MQAEEDEDLEGQETRGNIPSKSREHPWRRRVARGGMGALVLQGTIHVGWPREATGTGAEVWLDGVGLHWLHISSIHRYFLMEPYHIAG